MEEKGMNILFYYQLDIVPEMGGIERATYAVARELESRGFHCIFLAHRVHVDNDSFHSNIPQLYLPNPNVLDCQENEEYLHTLFEEMHIDVLINQDAMDYSSSKFLSKYSFPEVKIIGVFHFSMYGGIANFEDHFKQKQIMGYTSLPKYLLQRMLVPIYKRKLFKSSCSNYKEIYKMNDRIVLLCEHEKKKYPIKDASRLVAIPNPLTLDEESGYSHVKEKLIIIVSRLVYHYKRIDLFLRIWKMIEHSHPEWRVNILGDGPCRDYYCNLAKKWNLCNVSFCGRVAPDEYYKQASILCSTSTSEGASLVLTEGMMYGCVPIAFDSYSSAHDIISHMKDGVLIKPFDIKEYANFLKLLMSNEELRSKLSNNARIKAGKLSPKIIGEEWCKLLSCVNTH